MREIDAAKAALAEPGVVCALAKNGRTETSGKAGIRPILDWLAEPDDPLCGAVVADKVVGRAAALLFIHAGVKRLFAAVISEGAAVLLDSYGISYAFEQMVPVIINRAGNGQCPMEIKTAGIASPAEAYRLLRTMV